MKPISYALSDIVVKPEKEKYSRKKNPAVTFVEKVISRRTVNDPRQHDYYHYSTYDQKILAKNDFNEEEARKKKRYKQIDFICCAVAGHKGRAVAVYQTLQDDGAYTKQHVLYAGRKTYLKALE